jgi:hypothetical protein
VLPSAPPLPTRPARWRRRLAEKLFQGARDQAIIQELARENIPVPVIEAELRRARANPYVQVAQGIARQSRKWESVAAVTRSFAQLDPQHREVDRRPFVPVGEFLRTFYACSRPVILTGLVNSWCALRDWTPQRLQEAFGKQLVDGPPLRQGNPDEPATPGASRITFHQLVDHLCAAEGKAAFGFVAQYAFLQHAQPESWAPAIEAFYPDYLDASHAPGNTSLALEGSGFSTPLRHEPMNALIVQAHGQRRVCLNPPFEMDLLYNEGKAISPINPHELDLSRYPKFRDATVIELTIEPGEALFLPAGWWHSQRALGVNVSLTFVNFVFPNGLPANKKLIVRQ